MPYAIFVGALIPVYRAWYGPANFLWFSDLALFGVLLALYVLQLYLPLHWLLRRLLAPPQSAAQASRARTPTSG